jgi:carbamoyltransferase
MKVLGISAFFHDSAAAIVDSEQGVLVAAEEERFTRLKHDSGFPANAIRYCLQSTGLNIKDIDAIVFYERPDLKFHRVVVNWLRNAYSGSVKLADWLPGWRQRKFWTKEIIADQLGVEENLISFVTHHESHVYGAFGLSGFRSAAALTLDGVGEWECGVLGRVTKDGKFEKFANIDFPNSLGLLYSAFAEFLGFEVNEGEFKVMGMAAYGRPTYVPQIEQLFESVEPTNFRLNMGYFSFHSSKSTNITSRFVELFGDPRVPESEFLDNSDLSVTCDVRPDQQRYADIAKSLQVVLENIILSFARCARAVSGEPCLVYSGGVAYNSVVNGRLLRESGFEKVFVMPAAGDSGSAIGAAYAYLYKRGIARSRTVHMNLGFENSEAEIREALVNMPSAQVQRFASDQELVSIVAERLVSGQVGAIFRGRAEFGPRALGFRSIIADPRPIENKTRVNKAIKFREIFRPFAPMVAYDEVDNYFDGMPKWSAESPYNFMVAVASVHQSAQVKLGATTHVDGTARVQTVHPSQNPFVYELLKSFKEKSGVPVLLNTSFNRRGEPIVNSVQDALSVFEWTDLDFVIVGAHLVFKK